MRVFRYTYLLLSILLLTACGADDTFLVNGTVEGLGTQNLHIIDYSDGAIRTNVSTAVDSKFRFEGNSPEETVVEVYSNARALIGRFVAKNGDNIEVKFRQNEPGFMEISGNKTSHDLLNFLAKTPTDSLNSRIFHEVVTHPDRMLSGVLLAYYYDVAANPELADSMINLLNYDFIPYQMTQGLSHMLNRSLHQPDTIGEFQLRAIEVIKPKSSKGKADNKTEHKHPQLKGFTPGSKQLSLCIFNKEHALDDSIFDIANQFDSIGYDIYYFHATHDTTRLAAQMEKMPKATNIFWAPAGIAQPELADFRIMQFPYFVVVDSARAVSYRSQFPPQY